MSLTKLIINEIIKIFRRKSTIVFLTFSVVSFFLVYGLVFLQKSSQSKYTYIDNSIDFMQFEVNNLNNLIKTSTEEQQIILKWKIEAYEYAIKNNIQIRSVNGGYRAKLIMNILEEIDNLNNLNIYNSKEEYLNQKSKIDKIQKLLHDNSFYEYIEYNKENLEKSFKDKLLTQEEYNIKIKEQNLALKYEIDKYPNNSDATSWKKELIYDNLKIDSTIKSGYDYDKKEYLNEDAVIKLENQKKINTYRLDNNIPFNNIINSDGNTDLYYRWSYDSFAIPVSMFFIALLVILLASSSISEEISRGTIKFLLITPYKRYKILLAKLLSYILILVVVTLVLSQINVLLGNIFFPNTSNEYIYVSSNAVKVMNTNIYELLLYLLKLPQILIYILIGTTLSTLTRNTALSNTFTIVGYIGISLAISIVEKIVKIDFLKFLPFSNFDFESKLLPIKLYTNNIVLNSSNTNTTLEFSLIVISITAILLLITMFESFNKKDIV